MNYRADIDGIRSIAVLIVILFHYGIPGFAGGFIGVDVFFVLSGYLISSIIFSQTEKGTFSFSQFYFRRIRRLFPVYAVVMVVTFTLAYLLMLPRDFREFGQSLVASTVYLSNILFYMEAGYFDTASHLKPLLHTWSLSVEEQFYIVFPVFAWLTAAFSRKALFILFGCFTLASFAAAVLYIQQDISAVFYLYPFRAWEMFLGTLLATQMVPQIRSLVWNNVLAGLGILLVILPTFFYTDKILFPGLSALVPCFGTVLLLYTGSHQKSWLHQTLSSKGPVFIGKLSYSLYLWHWPLYVLYSYTKPQGLSTFDISIIALATFIASYLGYIFIETPFRQGKVFYSHNKIAVFGATAVFSFVCISAGFYLHITNGAPARLDPRTAAFAKAGGDLVGDFSGCVSEDNNLLPEMAFCPIGDPLGASAYTLVWGDSQTGAYRAALTHAMKGKNMHALLVWSGGCPAVFGVKKSENAYSKSVNQKCSKRNSALAALLERDRDKINAVVMVGRWSYYANAQGVGVDSNNKISIWREGDSPTSTLDQEQLFLDLLHETFQSLQRQGFPVFVVEQPPEFEQYIGRVLALGLMRGANDIETNFESLTTIDYQTVENRQRSIQKLLKTSLDSGLISVIQTHHYFCIQDKCSLLFDGKPAYFDNNHLSTHGAMLIHDMFNPLITLIENSER